MEMTINQSEIVKQKRIATIDVFRGIAIFAVIIFHAFGGRFTYNNFSGCAENISVTSFVRFLLAFGAAGVNLFFVISGFCIHAATVKIYDKADNRKAVLINWKNFFFKRFWRLYPVHFLTILIFAFIPGIQLWLNDQHFVVDTTAFWLHAFFLHTFSTHFFFSINPANWSLGTEVQFYLMYPLFLKLKKKIPTEKLLIYATAFSLIYRIGFILLLPKVAGQLGSSLSPVEDMSKYQLTAILGFGPVRFNDWLLGCYLAELIYLKKDPLRLAEIPLLVYVCIGIAAMISQFNAFAEVIIFQPATSFLFLGLMLHYLKRKDGIEQCAYKPALSLKCIGNKIKNMFAEMGLRAYSLYLLHFPLLHLVENGLREWMKPLTGDHFVVILFSKLTSVGFAIATSYLFYRFLERPLDIYSKQFRITSEINPRPAEKILG